MLVVITARKGIDQVNRGRRRKRRGGVELGYSALVGPGAGAEDDRGLDQLVFLTPTTSFNTDDARTPASSWRADTL